MKTKLTLLLIAFAMCLEGAFAKTIKILAIGNSFSEDAIEQNLHELAKAENIETVIGNLYIGGCPLKRHWENAEGNKPAYRYLKIAIDGKGVKTENERLADALSDEKWDYISLQQASGVSGLYSSYEPYLTNLVEYVKRHAPKAKIVWHQTWAYAQNSTHGEFPNYGNSQTQMYRMIVETAKTVMKSHKFSKIIPSGTAVQNARQTYIGDNMNRDGFHLNLVYGRYTAACAWFEAITGKSVVGNAYAPAAMDKRLTLTCQQAAHDAVKKPWDVTMQKPIQAAQTPEQAKAYAAQTFSKHDRLTPLAPGNLKLTGYFENDIQNSLTHWNKGVLPYAKIADFFRNGRAQFALGEMWGKAVLSGAMLYRYTGDQQLKAILQATVKDILTTVRENGSISCVPVNEQPDGKGGDLWERKYVLLALTAYYTYLEATPEVLEAMKGEANSIVDQIGDAPKHDILEQGWSWNGIESSSVLEPMMRMYEITGDKRYLEFSEYVIGKGGCRNANIFTQALENIPPHEMASGYPKAYEMNSVFNGLVEYYRMTGIGKWKQCFRNYFNNIKRHEITIVGNGGADEPYYPKWAGEAWDNTQKEQANPKIQRMMETCIGVSWMKFCSYVLRTTADASAADYIEKYQAETDSAM